MNDGPVVSRTLDDLDPEFIERNLRELWRDIENQHSEATQVRMLNLLVYLPAPAPPAVHAAIAAVAVRNPGRTITMVFEDSPPRADTTIACWPGGDSRHACGEQITIYGSVAGQPLHSLAIGLLQAGLPVTVWWQGVPNFDDHVFKQLANVADRFIVDSRDWSDPGMRLPLLASEAVAWRPRLRFSDLQWVELTAWRRIIAHAFDVPAARQALPEIDAITIGDDRSGHDTSRSLLLAGWLLSRLGWQPAGNAEREGDAVRIVAVRGTEDRPRTLRLRPSTNGVELDTVSLHTGGERPQHIEFELMPHDHCIRTRIELDGSRPLVQVSQVHERDIGQLLAEELAMTSPDTVYNDALEMTARLAACLVSLGAHNA